MPTLEQHFQLAGERVPEPDRHGTHDTRHEGGGTGDPGVVARGVPDSRLPPGRVGGLPKAAGPIEERTGPVQPIQDSLAKG